MHTGGKRYTLYLINPKRRYRYHWDLKEICRLMRKKTAVLPLALPTVAALTPDHYEIKIIDEEMENLHIDRKPDIVGITAMIPNITRAYEIADAYRAIGVPVAMGGAQVSFNVEESLRHADTIVVGEAEATWEHCLSDFEQGQMKPVYKADVCPEFKRSPHPRWDLVRTDKIMALGVQVSRGCPYHCEFCLVPNMFGSRQRYRDIDDVIDEIQNLPKKQISFVDDNLTADKNYARELMRRLKPLGVSWMCQASLDLADHEDLLKEMAEAGCTSILFGIESLNPASLNETRKKHNRIAKYESAIRRVHEAGIITIASFIVGFDADTLEAFDEIYRFTAENNIIYIMLNVLTAYPGTRLYERMQSDGRLTDIDTAMFGGVYPSFQFRQMQQSEVYQRYYTTLDKMYDYDHLRRKALHVLGNGRFQRFNAGEIRPFDKFLSLLYLFRMYILTRDIDKRRFFFDLMGLAFKKKACIGIVVEFLVFIASFHGYLSYTRIHRLGLLKKIRQMETTFEQEVS